MVKNLITGGNGFVGTFLADYLLKLGHEVIILDVIDDKDRDQRTQFVNVDITDYDKLSHVMKGVDFVFHSAALVPIKKSGDLYKRVNILGTENVMRASAENNVKHVVHISSSAIFGNVEKADCPLSTDPKNLNPVEIYGQSKLHAEEKVREYIQKSKKKEISTTYSIIRPRTVIGTKRLGIFQILFEWVSEGKNIFIIGDGKNIFQFIHVEDLCDAIYKSAVKGISEIYNVGSKFYYTLNETLSHLCKFSGTNSKVRALPKDVVIPILKILDTINLSPLAPWHYLTYHKDYFFDISKTEKLLDWKPKYDDKLMIEESYSWYLKNRHILQKNKSAHKSVIKQKILKLVKLFA